MKLWKQKRTFNPETEKTTSYFEGNTEKREEISFNFDIFLSVLFLMNTRIESFFCCLGLFWGKFCEVSVVMFSLEPTG